MACVKDTDDKIVRTSNLDYTPDPRGLGHVFFTHMIKHKDKVAQIDGLTGEEDTFGALLQRCIRTALAMRSRGVTPNDIVTLCTFNHLNSCVPFISNFFLGSKVASLDPTLSVTDTIHLLKQVGPKIIFVIPEALEMIEKAVEELPTNTQIVVFGDTKTHIPFAEFLRPNEEEINFKPVEPKSIYDTSLIFFSSGTSGLPKGICISQFSFLNQVVNTIGFGFCTDLILIYASFYWASAAVFCSHGIINGKTRLVLPKFDLDVIWEKIHQYKPTVMYLSPRQILYLASEGVPKGIDTTSLKDINIGGSPMLTKQLLKIRQVFPGTRVNLSYGMTECVGFITCFQPNNAKDMEFLVQKPSSSGTGIAGIDYKIVNPDTEEILGPNQKGELRLKTKFQLNGYYNCDSSDVWDSNGWLKTGDIAYYDEDKCFFVVDRIKETLKYQIWHVAPAFLENILLTHPAIKSAAVIGIPHEIDGDHPMAVVVLKPGWEDANPKEIEQYVEERVHDRQKLRGGVRFVDHIPITPTGKLKRREIKNMYTSLGHS